MYSGRWDRFNFLINYFIYFYGPFREQKMLRNWGAKTDDADDDGQVWLKFNQF